MNNLLLSEYHPTAECVVVEHTVTQPKFPVFDIHMHLGKLVLGNDYAKRYEMDNLIATLDSFNIKQIVNLDGVWGEDFDCMKQKIGIHANRISTFVWIDVEKIDEPDFYDQTRNHILTSYRQGARGIKMWKVISLNQKDKQEHYIRTDDDRLQVVYETAAELGIPILIHIADPTAFFRPVDERNERWEELCENPDWVFGQPGQYTFEELMEMQDEMIRKNPNTTFVVAHVGSYAENLSHVAQRLDMFPNMYIDIAARIAELGRVPYSAREFFLSYADRILYGTDATPLGMEEHPIYFRFLETFDEYFEYQGKGKAPGQGRWRIYGLGLPDDVLKKVYYQNACKILQVDLGLFESSD